MPSFQHILVPTDFSPPAEKATEIAVAIGASFGSRLTLLHVVPAAPFYGYEAARDWPLTADELPREARRVLDEALRVLQTRFPGAEAALLSGAPSEQILELARERGGPDPPRAERLPRAHRSGHTDSL